MLGSTSPVSSPAWAIDDHQTSLGMPRIGSGGFRGGVEYGFQPQLSDEALKIAPVLDAGGLNDYGKLG